MRLKILNQFLLVEPDKDLIPVDDDPRIEEIVKRGIIALPDKNTAMKLSPYATIAATGKDCKLGLKKGQRIIYDQFRDQPFWYFDDDGTRYRFITEYQVLGTLE